MLDPNYICNKLKRVEGQSMYVGMHTCLRLEENAEAVGHCVMLCMQYACNDDIAMFVLSSYK